MATASTRDDRLGISADAPRGPLGLRRGTAPPNFETLDLALEQDLRAAERAVAQAAVHGRLSDDHHQRRDQAHSHLAGWHIPSPSRSAPEAATPHAPPAGAPSTETTGIIPALAWTLVAIGVSVFVCGGVLWVWSFVGDRPDLARWGLPLVLGGQAGLILGLMLQLESLWQSTQQATQSLDTLDDRVAEIKHATALLGTTHSASSAGFYSHFAQGASSQMLLADLKGQLDLLAMKMAKDRS